MPQCSYQFDVINKYSSQSSAGPEWRYRVRNYLFIVNVSPSVPRVKHIPTRESLTVADEGLLKTKI